MVSYSQQTLDEIKKKALAGIPLVSPDASKNALYNQYKQSSNVAPAQPTTQTGNVGLTPKPIATPMNAAPQSPTSAVGLGGQQSQMSATKNMAAPTNNGNPNYNSNQSIPDYGAMTPGMIEQILSGYKSGGSQYYSPESDPVYNSMMELSTKQADKAGLATMETMNDRGILNSTVTSDRVGQIKQGASDAVLGAIPGLAANFSNQQANNQAGMQSLLNSVLGAGQFQQTFGEDNRRFDKNFTLDEAKVSGRYVPPEAQNAIQTILQGKEASANGGITPAQRAENNKKANEARQLLATLGIDISGLDTNVGYNDAIKNSSNIGRNSIPQQEMDLAKTEVMGRDTSTTAQGLIDQILRSKKASSDGGLNNQQRTDNAKTATTARNQLAALGFDVSGLAGNIGYDQALKNSKSIGQPTLKAVNDAAANKLAKDTLATQNDQFGREMDYKEQSALIDADLKSRGLDIEMIRASISQFSAESDAEYKQYQQEIGISDANAQKRTSEAIARIAKATSAAEALEILNVAGPSWADQGVDNREVVKVIYDMFPHTKAALEGDVEASSDRFGPKP